MLLHLLQDIPYIAFPNLPKEGEKAIAHLLSFIDNAPVGSEGCLRLSSILSALEGGYQDPPGEEMRLAVERGEKHPHTPGDFSIEAGKYSFLQLPIEVDAAVITKRVLELLSDGPSVIYLRVLKESVVEVVIQLIFKA